MKLFTQIFKKILEWVLSKKVSITIAFLFIFAISIGIFLMHSTDQIEKSIGQALLIGSVVQAINQFLHFYGVYLKSIASAFDTDYVKKGLLNLAQDEELKRAFTGNTNRKPVDEALEDAFRNTIEDGYLKKAANSVVASDEFSQAITESIKASVLDGKVARSLTGPELLSGLIQTTYPLADYDLKNKLVQKIFRESLHSTYTGEKFGYYLDDYKRRFKITWHDRKKGIVKIVERTSYTSRALIKGSKDLPKTLRISNPLDTDFQILNFDLEVNRTKYFTGSHGNISSKHKNGTVVSDGKTADGETLLVDPDRLISSEQQSSLEQIQQKALEVHYVFDKENSYVDRRSTYLRNFRLDPTQFICAASIVKNLDYEFETEETMDLRVQTIGTPGKIEVKDLSIDQNGKSFYHSDLVLPRQGLMYSIFDKDRV